MNETYLLIGRIQITIQIFLWLCAIQNCIFNILPNMKLELFREFFLTTLLTFHIICLIRNFYMVIHQESYITTEIIDTYIKDIQGGKDTISKCNQSNEYEGCLFKDELEICKKCDCVRLKRSHHCSICNRCVEMMDHHCIVMNSCIGRRNYKYFLSYLFLVVLNSFFIFVLSGFSIYCYANKSTNDKYSLMYYLYFPFRTAFDFIISLCAFFSIGMFFIYHVTLVYYDITSLEHKYKLYRGGKKIPSASRVCEPIYYDEGIINSQNTQNFLKKYFSVNINSKLLYDNFLKILGGKSILEIYWPE